MEKPITLRINELKTNLVNTINDANLPPFLLEQILRELYSEASTLATNQAKKEEDEYYKSLQEKENIENIEKVDGEVVE